MVDSFLERSVNPDGFITRLVTVAYGAQSQATCGDGFVDAIHVGKSIDDTRGQQHSTCAPLLTASRGTEVTVGSVKRIDPGVNKGHLVRVSLCTEARKQLVARHSERKTRTVMARGYPARS